MASSQDSVLSAKESRAKRLTCRTENTEYVVTMLARLFTVSLSVVFTPDYTPDEKEAQRRAKRSEQERATFSEHIANIRDVSDRILPLNPDGTRTENKKKILSRFISCYNNQMNWLNTMSANLRRAAAGASAELTEFDQFVAQHAFPTYDAHNGFQSLADAEAQIVRIMNPRMPVVVAHIDDSEFDLSNPVDADAYASTLKLKCSRRKVLVATPVDPTGGHVEFFSGALNYAIEHAELVEPVEPVPSEDWAAPPPRKPKVTRYSADPEIKNGTFYDFALNLKFPSGKTLASNSREITARMPTAAAKAGFNTACRRRIIHLISARDPTKTYKDFLVFCRHPGCGHADGFIHSHRPRTTLQRLQARPSCPADHAFCLACLQPAHAGLCQDIDADRRALLAMPGTNPCPTCKAPIEKNGGCNHMHCERCGQNFCWTCGMTFSTSDGYLAHAGCNQFS